MQLILHVYIFVILRIYLFSLAYMYMIRIPCQALRLGR